MILFSIHSTDTARAHSSPWRNVRAKPSSRVSQVRRSSALWVRSSTERPGSIPKANGHSHTVVLWGLFGVLGLPAATPHLAESA